MFDANKGVSLVMTNSKFTVVRLNCKTYPPIPEEEEELKKIGAEVVYIEGSSQEEILSVARNCDALGVVSSKVREGIINQLEKCRIIARYGIGVDNIDIDAATKNGIIVTNVPDFCINEMAEHTMALILGVTRKIVKMDENTRNCKWSSRVSEHLRRLRGQKLGLIGFGSSAKEVTLRSIPFGLKVYAYDPYVNEEVIREYKAEPASFEFIIKNCDIISLHVPLNSNTYHLIGESELKSMKQEAVLINTSRGAIVDEDALIKALKEGWIRYAGLDVFEKINVFNESEKKIDHPLFHLDNVILSPHCAACSDESLIEQKKKAVKEIVAVLSGKWPKNCVNPGVIPRFPLAKDETN